MSVFVDASAMIAIIAGEGDADRQADMLEHHANRYTSPIAIWEAAVGLARSFAVSQDAARTLIAQFLATGDIVVIPIDQTIALLALTAHATYGKGRHPAALNMGDCFAYACAKTLSATLIYKGNDFAKTDLA